MDIDFSKEDNVVVCAVSGEVDMYAAPDFHEKYRSHAAKESGSPFVIDLGRATYLDSSGIGVLFQIFSDARSRRVGFCICNVTGMVEKLFKLSRMSSILPIESNLHTAIERARRT